MGLCKFKDGYFIFNEGLKTEYDISVPLLATEKQFLEWLTHMIEKDWFTKEHIEAFIREFAEYKKIKLFS